MDTQETSQFAGARLDARALLGLYDPAGETDWGPIRAAQLNAASRLAVFMLATNVIGASLILSVFAPFIARWQLICWAVLVAVASIAVTLRRLSVRRHTRLTATIGTVRKAVIDGIALAAIWSIPPLAFLPRADAGAALGLWIVISLLMSGASFALAGLPLATIVFLILTGAATAAGAAMVASPIFAAVTLAYTALLVGTCIARATSLVVLRANEIVLAERNETVSLLLREFEDTQCDWLWETDTQRRIVGASARFAKAAGADPATINGRPLVEILAGPAWQTGDFAPALRTLAEKLKARESFRELRLPVHVNEEERWWKITASPRHDEEGLFCGFRGVASDVTEQFRSADKINRMARYDTLTGLANRLLINETLARAMADADQWNSRCAFMMIDLDRFKAVNDTLGHPVGDRLLSHVSQRLGQLMTDNEMIGRLGGDEFAVVVRDASDTAKLEALALSIIESLSRPYEVDQHTLYIGASVGLAVGPRDGRTAEMLIRSADLALYRSKDAGGGIAHVYDPQLHVQAEERRVLEIELRHALEKNELHLNYQPVVNARTGALSGFEALLRWHHPELGNVSPAKFIPLAEEARLIAPIGEWVLRTACHEAASWNTDIRVAVNVSPEQLHSPNFVNLVTQTLAQSGLPANRLELEVTESVFLREGTGAIKVLDQLLSLGIRLSLDDFGTGYSSLGYLSRTKFSTIKIDRSFVQGASQNKREAVAIIRAVVALADSLDMATTAEGVETEQEHELVERLGCTKVQGYYFGRPLPVVEARKLIARAAGVTAAA